jgi:hypothetical protein
MHMTAEQAEWLREHRAEGYRVCGQPPADGHHRFVKVGMLYPDGSFERKQSAHWRYTKAIEGMFECGVLTEV